MSIQRHLNVIKENLEYLISNPKKALATTLLVGGMTFGNANAQESKDIRPDSTSSNNGRYTLYQEIIPDNTGTLLKLNARETVDELHRSFTPFPNYNTFVNEFKTGRIKEGIVKTYSIDPTAIRLLEKSFYPKAGISDLCGYSQKIAEKLEEFLNNKEVVCDEDPNGRYAVGYLNPEEKCQLSALIKSYGLNDFLIGVLQKDEPFVDIVDGKKEYHIAEETPQFLLIRSECDIYTGKPCATPKVTKPKCKDCGDETPLTVQPYIGLEGTYFSSLEKAIPELAAGLRAGPIIIGIHGGGINYTGINDEKYPNASNNGFTNIHKDIESKLRNYGADLGVVVYKGFTLFGGVQNTTKTDDITGTFEQCVRDANGNQKYVKEPLDPEKVTTKELAYRAALGFTGKHWSIYAGPTFDTKGKANGGFGGARIYFGGKK